MACGSVTSTITHRHIDAIVGLWQVLEVIEGIGR